ncbi:aldose epimerase family protein [Pseudoflavonifractor phocaeensis]|uniref:aldose epimerase family protein n=1 Tax=Pseudoflavonifractor phocaeensis TaxID=1870988 RepID=UPI00210999B8|nr:galactose-1-epimerase [Pseudoflavonifractor phocaeensis]MCQ4865447.1 galactose mutarotase [Pseudoflavonifractor phocaeensis]
MTELTSRPFGATAEGTLVECWTLDNHNGMTAEILTYGGILRTLTVPSPTGPRDVVLGLDTVADYEANPGPHLGALVGRVAGRIKDAFFTLGGKEYRLTANAAPNCLHGGERGYAKRVWQAGAVDGRLVLTYFSPDGEEHFPGNLKVKVVYALTADNALTIEYFAETDAETIVNLTNHSYFNLSGHGAGSVGNHTAQFFADYITENGPGKVPSGAIVGVGGTPFDLREPRALAPGLAGGHPQIAAAGGYDHNFVLKSRLDGVLETAAVIEADGLRMECETTQPGVQFYTANFLDVPRGKDGAAYGVHSGLCLETQGWPDAVHHPDFPSPVLKPGEVYHHLTVYRFSSAG